MGWRGSFWENADLHSLTDVQRTGCFSESVKPGAEKKILVPNTPLPVMLDFFF